jgi:hypothetical protein
MTSVDTRKLGCWSLFQVGAFGMIELLKKWRVMRGVKWL